MTLESERVLYVVLFIAATCAGVFGSLGVNRRYRQASADDALTAPERMLLRILVIVCWVITAAALYLGFLSVRRLLGFDAIGFLSPVSYGIALAVLSLPAAIYLTLERIAKWRT